VAEPGEGIGSDELALAARNHGMPLEALRYDLTPAGLHYLLIHYDIPACDAATWRLAVGGRVSRPLNLSLDDIRARPQVTTPVTIECAGNGRARLIPRPVSQPWLTEAVGNAEWTGTPLAPVLREAGVAEDAVDVVFTGADHGVERGVEQDYARALPLREALQDEVLLAWAMNGAPLPPQHGYPLRLVVPGWYGMAHVKWLRRIDVVSEPFDGYQHHAYRLRQDAEDPGIPVTRMEPRALMAPPGWPDFMSRRRFARPGTHRIEGRAWSGWGDIEAVEVSTDAGAHWEPADLGPRAGRHGWRRWSWTWRAAPGTYTLTARATDATGRVQPIDQRWNRGGFANNAAQRVDLLIIDERS
jgi:sulfane dehydrogenase subunit SoxC